MEVSENLDGFSASINLCIFVFRRILTTGSSALQVLDRVRQQSYGFRNGRIACIFTQSPTVHSVIQIHMRLDVCSKL